MENGTTASRFPAESSKRHDKFAALIAAGRDFLAETLAQEQPGEIRILGYVRPQQTRHESTGAAVQDVERLAQILAGGFNRNDFSRLDGPRVA